MKFIYNGRRADNNELSGFSGITFFIGCIALFWFFTMADFDDLMDYAIELILLFLMIGSIVYKVVRKKADYLTSTVFMQEDSLWMKESGAIPLENLRLDIYYQEGKFERYHLWDSFGNFTVFSVHEDDLMEALKNASIEVNEYQIANGSASASSIEIKREDGTTFLYYLDTGKYYFISPDQEEKEVTPTFYAFDPKYKLSKTAVVKD
jgi:hypothetical protein